MINKYSRYQSGLNLSFLYPSKDGFCACGCGQRLTGKQKRWASIQCRDNSYINFAIIKGDNSIIRQELFKRDHGFCYSCGVYDNGWEADHIISIKSGGGASDLSNFQTLCKSCHKEKSKKNIKSSSTIIQSPDMKPLTFALI